MFRITRPLDPRLLKKENSNVSNLALFLHICIFQMFFMFKLSWFSKLFTMILLSTERPWDCHHGTGGDFSGIQVAPISDRETNSDSTPLKIEFSPGILEIPNLESC